MEEITLGQLLQAVNGTLLGPFQNTSAIIQKVDTDSRNMHPGSLFIPLVGDRFDGHAYINAARWAVLPPGSGRAIGRISSM